MHNRTTSTTPAARAASLPLLAGLALALPVLCAHAQTPTTAPASATAGTTSARPAQLTPGLAPASPAQGGGAASGFVPAGSNPVVPTRVGRGALRPALIDLEFLAQQPRLLTPRNLRPLPGAGLGADVATNDEPKVIALPDKPRERPVGLTFKPEPVATPTTIDAPASEEPQSGRVVNLPFPSGLEPDAQAALAAPEAIAPNEPSAPAPQVMIGQVVPLPTPMPVIETTAPAPAPVAMRAEPTPVRELPSGLEPAREATTSEVTSNEPVITRTLEPALVAVPVMPIAPVLPFPPEASANLPASTAGFSQPVMPVAQPAAAKTTQDMPAAEPAPVAQAEPAPQPQPQPLPMPMPAADPVLAVAAPASEPVPSPAPAPMPAPADVPVGTPSIEPMPAAPVREVPATMPEPVVLVVAPAPEAIAAPEPVASPAAPVQPAPEIAPVVVQREPETKFNSIELVTPQTAPTAPTPAAQTPVTEPSAAVEAPRAPKMVATPAPVTPDVPVAPATPPEAPVPALAADPALANVPQLEVRPAPEPIVPALTGTPVPARTPEAPEVIAPAPELVAAPVAAPAMKTDAPVDAISDPLNSAIERAAAQLLSSQAAAKAPAPTPAPTPATSALPELLPTPEAPALVLNKPAPATGNDVRPAPASGSALDPFTARSEGVRVRVAELSGTQGMVQWLKDGSPDWNIPELSEQDSGKFTVRTGPDAGALLTLDDAHRVRLGRLSRADLRSMSLPEAGSTRRVVVALTRGRVAVTPAPGSAVNVYTPTSMIVVREPTEVIHDTAGGTRTVSYVEKAPAAAEVPVP